MVEDDIPGMEVGQGRVAPVEDKPVSVADDDLTAQFIDEGASAAWEAPVAAA